MKRQTLINYLRYSEKPISKIIELAKKSCQYLQKEKTYHFKFDGQPLVILWLDNNGELEASAY